MKGKGWRIGGLCLALWFALEGAAAQQSVGQPAVEDLMEQRYRELQVREQLDAARRLDVLRLQGEAERLTVETQEIEARAKNCAARRKAFEAGAGVNLCKNDMEGGEVQGLPGAGENPIEEDLRIAEMEARMAAMEAALRESSAADAAPDSPVVSVAPAVAAPTLTEPKAVLVLLGPARAVVRLAGRRANELYRIPVEARLDGENCIVTSVGRSGLDAGVRICRSGGAS